MQHNNYVSLDWYLAVASQPNPVLLCLAVSIDLYILEEVERPEGYIGSHEEANSFGDGLSTTRQIEIIYQVKWNHRPKQAT